MTIRTNETVLNYDDYSKLTIQDFEVTFKKNSEEEDQSMDFELVNVTAQEITVNLTFENPILVSQGKLPDQIIVKLNKDLFLLP